MHATSPFRQSTATVDCLKRDVAGVKGDVVAMTTGMVGLTATVDCLKGDVAGLTARDCLKSEGSPKAMIAPHDATYVKVTPPEDATAYYCAVGAVHCALHHGVVQSESWMVVTVPAALASTTIAVYFPLGLCDPETCELAKYDQVLLELSQVPTDVSVTSIPEWRCDKPHELANGVCFPRRAG